MKINIDDKLVDLAVQTAEVITETRAAKERLETEYRADRNAGGKASEVDATYHDMRALSQRADKANTARQDLQTKIFDAVVAAGKAAKEGA